MKTMLRLPAISVVIVSMLVSSNPVLPYAVVQKDAAEPSGIAQPKIEATNNSPISNSSVEATSVNPAENKTGSVNVTKTAVTPKAADVTETTPQRIAKPNETDKHEKCNSTKETEDMQGCHVTPSDSGENVDDNTAQNAIEPTTIATAVTKKAEVNKTESQTPKPSPDIPKENDNKTNNKEKVNNDNKEENDNNKKKKVTEGNDKNNSTVSVVPLIKTESTNQVSYDVVTTEASQQQNTNDSGNSIKSTTVQPVAVNNTTVSNNSVAPLVTDKGANLESRDIVAQVKSANRNKSMPSGVIALITAMSFGVAIAIVYIGMIVWRRYVEYRYGHRELLVNELEFDSNDLRHFEL